MNQTIRHKTSLRRCRNQQSAVWLPPLCTARGSKTRPVPRFGPSHASIQATCQPFKCTTFRYYVQIPFRKQIPLRRYVQGSDRPGCCTYRDSSKSPSLDSLPGAIKSSLGDTLDTGRRKRSRWRIQAGQVEHQASTLFFERDHTSDACRKPLKALQLIGVEVQRSLNKMLCGGIRVPLRSRWNRKEARTCRRECRRTAQPCSALHLTTRPCTWTSAP